jgi:hypothetical protein
LPYRLPVLEKGTLDDQSGGNIRYVADWSQNRLILLLLCLTLLKEFLLVQPSRTA